MVYNCTSFLYLNSTSEEGEITNWLRYGDMRSPDNHFEKTMKPLNNIEKYFL